MSLIHLSSQGDNGGTATRFSNFFPNPIVIEPNSQVALVNVVLNPNGNVQIDDSNNVLFFSIGAITGGAPNPQHKITVPEGEYSAQLLADTLTDLLNDKTSQQPYRKLVGGTLGWNVSIVKDTTTLEPRAFKFSNTQNLQPAIEGFNKKADYQSIAVADFDSTDQNEVSQTIAGTAMLRVIKVDEGEGSAPSADENQSAFLNKRGIYRGLSSTGGKPAIYYHVAPYDDDGDGAFHTFHLGIIRSAFVENDDGTNKDFDTLNKLDEDGEKVPWMDIGFSIWAEGDSGEADAGAVAVAVYSETGDVINYKKLLHAEDAYTYPLNGASAGYLFKLEWQTTSLCRLYVSEATDYTSFTHLYSATKDYSTSLDQLYQIAYNKEPESSYSVSGIFNPDIVPNVFQMREDTVMLKAPDLTASEDDSGLSTYRNKNIRMSVGPLANDQYLTGEGTIGGTIGANESLLTLTTIDATFQEATYTTSGRPSFHGNLGTAHISLPNLPIKSYLGKSSNIGKDIAIIPRFESDSIDPSDALFYEASEKNWIDLKNVEEITTNELTVGIKDSSNKDLEGIHKPTAITILFRKKRM